MASDPRGWYAVANETKGWLVRLALIAAACVAGPTCAQQTIVNVPSVDQTAKGHFFYLHESQVRDWGGNSFWQTTNFFTYGVTDRLEVAMTVYNVGTPAAINSAVGLGWKTAQPVLRERLPSLELTVGAGQMVQISYTGQGTGVWSYGQAAFRVPVLRTRLMGGISSGPRQVFGVRSTHAIASFEQPLDGVAVRFGRLAPIVSNMAIVGEWWSGRHELADFVIGANYHTKPLVVVVGYKLSNKPGSRTDGVILEIGRKF